MFIRSKFSYNSFYSTDYTCSYIATSEFIGNRAIDAGYSKSFIFGSNFDFALSSEIVFRDATIAETSINIYQSRLSDFENAVIVQSDVSIKNSDRFDFKNAVIWGSRITIDNPLVRNFDAFSNTNITGSDLRNIRMRGRADFSGTHYCRGFPKPLLPDDYEGPKPQEVECEWHKAALRESLRGYSEYDRPNSVLASYPLANPVTAHSVEPQRKCQERETVLKQLSSEDILQTFMSLKKSCVRERDRNELLIRNNIPTVFVVEGRRGVSLRYERSSEPC